MRSMSSHEFARYLLSLPDLPINTSSINDTIESVNGAFFKKDQLMIGHIKDSEWGPKEPKIFINPTGVNNRSEFKKITITSLDYLKKFRDQSKFEEPLILDWILDWVFIELLFKNKYDEVIEAIQIMAEIVAKIEELTSIESAKFINDTIYDYARRLSIPNSKKHHSIEWFVFEKWLKNSKI